MNWPPDVSWFGHAPLLGGAALLGFTPFRRNSGPASLLPEASRRPVVVPRRSVEERISAAMRNWIEERADIDLAQAEAAVPEPESPPPDVRTPN